MAERRDVPEVESEAVGRGRLGRQTAEERQEAALEVLAGKASVDHVARRLGVVPALHGWHRPTRSGTDSAVSRSCSGDLGGRLRRSNA